MLVKDALKHIGIVSDDSREVKGISFDSRTVEDGYIFIAFKGNTCDGNDYICNAFRNGAVCVISDRLVGYDIYKSNDINKDKVTLLKTFYKYFGMKLIGITGTNGKTSSAHLLYQTLTFMGIRTTYIGTLGVIDNDYSLSLDNTTPDMDILYREIYKAMKRKNKCVIMEVSSHSLSMNRVDPVDFDVIAFTNFSQDHLDYHKDMDNYFKAKKLLFDRASNKCIGVVNSEESKSKEIICDFKGKVVTYGKDSNYDYDVIENSMNSLTARIKDNIIHSKLIYKTNIYNLVLVYAILCELGYSSDSVISAIEKCNPVDGRMEVLSNNEKVVVLDYAHTPDALKRIILETNKIKKGRTVVLFGCGGNRDKSKRKIMGEIANKYADLIYLTNDNPRDEDALDIINDILKGITTESVIVELDREKAISKAIKEISKGDILLVLGKGHENYQIIKNQKTRMSDREIIQKCLEN